MAATILRMSMQGIQPLLTCSKAGCRAVGGCVLAGVCVRVCAAIQILLTSSMAALCVQRCRHTTQTAIRVQQYSTIANPRRGVCRCVCVEVPQSGKSSRSVGIYIASC